MTEREYREKADSLLVLMQADSISYQEYTRRQSQLVNEFYTSRIASKGTRPCTCTGACRGASGLGDGWYCVLSELKGQHSLFVLKNNTD